MFFNLWGWRGCVGLEGIIEVYEEDKELERRNVREVLFDVDWFL